jgi:hypothetical protein
MSDKLLEALGFKKAAPVDPRASIQDWMPIADIEDGYAVAKNGDCIGYLRVYPIDITLMSENEKARIIAAVKEAINGEKEPFEIFSIPRPVDLEAYLGELNSKVAQAGNPKRRLVLRDSIEYAVKTVASGSCVERQHYIICRQRKGTKAEEELYNRLSEFRNRLRIAGIRAEICGDNDIITVCSLFAAPQMTAMLPNKFELSIVPTFEGGKE